MAIAVARSGEQDQDIQESESVDSSSVLWEIAEGLAKSQEFGKAQEVAKSIKNSGKRDRAISAVARIARNIPLRN